VKCEAKRKANLIKHGLDFADARRVFEGLVIRVISMRKADKHETNLYFKAFGTF